MRHKLSKVLQGNVLRFIMSPLLLVKVFLLLNFKYMLIFILFKHITSYFWAKCVLLLLKIFEKKQPYRMNGLSNCSIFHASTSSWRGKHSFAESSLISLTVWLKPLSIWSQKLTVVRFNMALRQSPGEYNGQSIWLLLLFLVNIGVDQSW